MRVTDRAPENPEQTWRGTTQTDSLWDGRGRMPGMVEQKQGPSCWSGMSMGAWKEGVGEGMVDQPCRPSRAVALGEEGWGLTAVRWRADCRGAEGR